MVELPAAHTCPASQLTYFGQCPNISCPANLSRQRSTPHGCFLQQPNKSLIDLGHQLHLSMAEIKRRYQRGLTLANQFVQFYHWLLKRREQSPPPHCRNCGVPLASAGSTVCFRQTRCAQRQQFVQRMARRYPMNLTALAITPEEFWAIVLAQNQDKLRVLPLRRLARANKHLARLGYLKGELVDAGI